MNNPQRSPMDQLNGEQSSYASSPGYRQADLPYQLPKIDHAFIIENYRRLRMHQRNQLAQLRIPDDLKRRIFNFRQDQDLKFQKPELVIFNHPFRGKTVMTRQEVQKELQKQRRNAQLGQQKQSRGQKVQQNILNEMGLQQEQVIMQKAKMTRSKSSQNQEEYQKKPRLTSDQPEKKLAEEINKQQEDRMKGNIFFISKQQKKVESQSQRTQKMKKLIRQKQDSKQKSQTSGSKQKSNKKDKRSKDYKDMPIIGQEPVVVRDIKFDEKRDQKSKNNLKSKEISKGFYRPFGNQMQIREFQKHGRQHEEDDQRLASGQAFIKKRKHSKEYQFERNGSKSLSEISAIQSKDFEEDDLSNSQSLNNALFVD